MRVMTGLAAVVLMMGCASAATDAGPGAGEAASPAGSFELFTDRPSRLVVGPDGEQMGPMPGVRQVYAQLLQAPEYRSGQDGFDRSVVLWLMVGASGGAELTLDEVTAWFEGTDGTSTDVTAASCGPEQLHHVARNGDPLYGCVAFNVPAAPGRLQLRSPHPRRDHFSYFVELTT